MRFKVSAQQPLAIFTSLITEILITRYPTKSLSPYCPIRPICPISPILSRSESHPGRDVLLRVALLKKRLRLEAGLYTILQILSLTLFEKMPISQALTQLPPPPNSTYPHNHQCLPGF
jgi:hypothetical protein